MIGPLGPWTTFRLQRGLDLPPGVDPWTELSVKGLATLADRELHSVFKGFLGKDPAPVAGDDLDDLFLLFTGDDEMERSADR